MSKSISNAHWRQTVNTVAQDLLVLSETGVCPATPVAAKLGQHALEVPVTDLEKAEFNAPARAAVHLLAKAALFGEGTETRFLYAFPELAAHMTMSGYLIYAVHSGLELSGGNTSEQFRVLEQAAFDHPYRKRITHGTIKNGDLPLEIADFAELTVPLLQSHPKIQAMDRLGRVAIAHELSAVLIGRAMPNIGNLPASGNTSARPCLTAFIGKVDMRVVGGLHQLVDTSGRPLASGHRFGENLGPTLKCAAHAALEGGEHTDLERFVAAGVNLIGDAGFYDRA